MRDQQNPDGDSEITLVGLWPWEKFYEERVLSDIDQSMAHPLIGPAQKERLGIDEIANLLDQQEQAPNILESKEAVAIPNRLATGSKGAGSQNVQEK